MASRKKKIASVQPRDVVHIDISKDESAPKFKYQSVAARNDEQRYLIQTIHKNDFTFVLGCSGSGKTHIACGVAAQYLKMGWVDRIILTRPQVAAEDAGYLPGNEEEKINPFLRPLFTELGYYLDVKAEIAAGTIQIIPIAYARGLTWKNSFILCDEFQNMDYGQIKLVLTRFGEDSKMLLTGDVSQSDLVGKMSKDCIRALHRMKGLASDPDNRISIVELKHSVRHPIIEKITNALED